MDINQILPYVKRIKPKPDTHKACVFEHKKKIKTQLEKSEVIDEITDDPVGCHLFVVNFSHVKPIDEYGVWEKMAPMGWLVIPDTEANRIKVKEFRREKKITSILTQIDGMIYFQKENYADRGQVVVVDKDHELYNTGAIEETQMKVVSDSKNNAIKVETSEAVEVPDWNNSVLDEIIIEKYGNGDVFVDMKTGRGETVELVRRMKSHKWHTIYSVESDNDLFDKAIQYFDFDDRIELLFGDALPNIGNKQATFLLYADSPNFHSDIDYIKDTGRYDHTIFVCHSSNGEMPSIGVINPNYITRTMNGITVYSTVERDVKSVVTEKQEGGVETEADAMTALFGKPIDKELPTEILSAFVNTNEKKKPKIILLD